MTNSNINKTYLIVLLGILAAIGPFTIDMYLPGFQQIAKDFSTNEHQVAYTLTSYFIGIAIGQLFYGPIVDKYGRKKPLIFGLLIYLLAAFGCAISNSIEMMIAMRFIQALGGCVGMVASTAIISDVYAVNDRARAFSSIMLVMGVAPLIAPSVGSFFIEHLSWHYVFYFLTVFSSLVVGLIYFNLPETSKYMNSEKLNPKKIILNYWLVLKNRTFFYYTLAGSLVMSVLFAYISSASFVFLTYYELDKTSFSILFAINASGLISGTYVNGRLTKRFNFIKIGNIAVIVLFVISLIFSFLIYVNPKIPYQVVVLGLFLILFNIGFINPNALAASMAPFTGNTGAASALGGSLRMGVAAVIAAIIGTIPSENAFLLFFVILILSVFSFIMYYLLPKLRIK